MLNSTAEYRDVSGFPGYRVGSDGSVWCRKFGKARKLKGMPVYIGYLRVALYPGPRRVFIHRLVLESFVGPCPAGMECCHADGDVANNSLSNLRWDTRASNMADRDRHGRTARGERQHLAKLSDEAVRLIRSEYELCKSMPQRRRKRRQRVARGTVQALAAKFGVSCGTIKKAARGETWKQVG